MDRKYEALLQGRASASVFTFLAKYVTEMINLKFAAVKYKQHMRSIAMGPPLVPVFMVCTTASLWHS